MQKYLVKPYLIEAVLPVLKSGEIAIPEIKRPFVWDSSKVHAMIDSLYQGYPVRYSIAWKNPNVRLKDGSLIDGKKVLIDRQQRITALTVASLVQEVVTQNYKRVGIKLPFNLMNKALKYSIRPYQKINHRFQTLPMHC